MSYTKTIYYNNKPLILTNDIASLRRRDVRVQGYLHAIGAFPRHYRMALEYLDRRQSLGAVIEDISPQALNRGMEDLYAPIDAAGGVVQNEHGDVLMIYRRGRWDLPKGKRDEGETIETCALREVAEETGLNDLTLGRPLPDTFHLYAQHGQRLLKRTQWFGMEALSSATLTPQAAENIEEVRWIRRGDLPTTLFKTYEAIRGVVKAALESN